MGSLNKMGKMMFLTRRIIYNRHKLMNVLNDFVNLNDIYNGNKEITSVE